MLLLIDYYNILHAQIQCLEILYSFLETFLKS